MANFPTNVTRVTNHNPPRYMFYIPGFNPTNSCWLHGSWVTVSEDRYKREAKKHQKMFGDLKQKAGDQHYRNKGTAISKLSPEQKMAWEHFSGESVFTCYHKDTDKNTHMVRVPMAGKGLSEESIKWLRKMGYCILPEVSSYGKTYKQLRGIKNVPKDLIAKEEKVVDTVEATIKQNTDFFDEMAEASLKDGDSPLGMGVHRIIELEEAIVRSEWNKSIGEEDPYEDVYDSAAAYKKLRKLAVKCLGAKEFNKRYTEQKNAHNECARANLGDRGMMYCYVLPKFKADGTHEPWGEKDVPWGTVKKKKNRGKN